jgi:hypothetical protein
MSGDCLTFRCCSGVSSRTGNRTGFAFAQCSRLATEGNRLYGSICDLRSIVEAGLDATAAKPIETYGELIQALRDRLCEVNTPLAGVDHLAGLPDRHAAAVLAPHPRKAMNAIHLLWIAQSLGLRVMLVADDEALARLRRRSDWHEMVRSGPRWRPSPARRRHKRASVLEAPLAAGA